MNASEFLVALAALPGARAVPVEANGIAESKLVAGVEIARAASPDERALRRAWWGQDEVAERVRAHPGARRPCDGGGLARHALLVQGRRGLAAEAFEDPEHPGPRHAPASRRSG